MHKINSKIKVMAAMSGGVDSSVAAYLLKESGYDVTGVTMCFGISDNEKKMNNSTQRNAVKCCGIESINDAARVCSLLGINHYVYDFSSEMQKYVIKPFIKAYMEGKTPNPCIECNRFLKFDILLKKAKALGFNYLATGHYAGIIKRNNSLYLSKAIDEKKDQSYFLYTIRKESLKNILFPLYKYTKHEVRKIAKSNSLPVAAKAESQEICFVPNDNYRKFIGVNKELSNKPGQIIDVNGSVLGSHDGVFNYTVGQRKGIKISSRVPLYVLSIDSNSNNIVVGNRSLLGRKKLTGKELNLLIDKLPERAKAKIRYNHKETDCKIRPLSNSLIEVVFDDPQDAVTPGQSIVFYDDSIVIGGAVISAVS